DLLLVEGAELPQPSAAVQQREEQIDDDADEAEPAAAEREPTAHAAAAGVRDLPRVQPRTAAEPHRGVSTSPAQPRNRPAGLDRAFASFIPRIGGGTLALDSTRSAEENRAAYGGV